MNINLKEYFESIRKNIHLKKTDLRGIVPEEIVKKVDVLCKAVNNITTRFGHYKEKNDFEFFKLGVMMSNNINVIMKSINEVKSHLGHEKLKIVSFYLTFCFVLFHFVLFLLIS